MNRILCILVTITIGLMCSVKADTPANCTYEDIRGYWRFYESPRGLSKFVNCTNMMPYTTTYDVILEFPNIAVDLDGNVGYWTIIYNQGFEVVINDRKYFAFSYYTQQGDNVTSYCKTTFNSSSHAVGVNPNYWSCFYGQKQDDKMTPKINKIKNKDLLEKYEESVLYQTNPEFVEAINKAQSSWKATHYEWMNKKTIGGIIRMAGGKKSKGFQKPKPAKVTDEVWKQASKLPSSFDWRNVNGVNYVSPIRNQKECGSCYAFGSMALHEARIRVKSNNTVQKVFSTQDIVECSYYSQGCDGGFPYLVAGKYAEDFGIVEESCNPYKGTDGSCHTDPTCTRHYATNYRYIGGFYGACNEPLMRIALVKDGPVAVSFEVYDDFLNYQGGIYHHTGLKDRSNFGFNPFEITNHVVLVVGYGTDSASGQDFWIVKNSWGTEWGENGFFRISRGNDECAIESIAVESDIIV